jgi:propionate CoA-transferase
MTVISARAAAELVADNATLAVSGIAVCGWAEEVGIAIEQAFLETGHPRDLTLVHAAGIGNYEGMGLHHLGHEGLVSKWIGAHTDAAPGMAHLVEHNKCQAYCLPQGVVLQLYREIAAHRPGVITKVGLGTFVDPRLEGAKLNSVTTADYVKVIELDGEEYLFYKAFPIDVALIRGTTADELGNLTMDEEALLLEQLPLAQAAKNSRGIVIAQAKYIARAHSLHPKHVRVPAALIDHVVEAAPEHHLQTALEQFNPAFSGDIKVPLSEVPAVPMDERLVVGRRAAMELAPWAVVNCGVGFPDIIGSVTAQEDAADLVTLTTEPGAIGGEPATGMNFGAAYNADAFVEHPAQFDWYDGGGIDVAFLGLGQADRHGNVNVSRFGGRAVGIGGFVNISQGAKTIVYCGAFTAGGLKVATGDGQLRVLTEGKHRKFVDAVEQISFSGAYATKFGQRVVYVTERAVFELHDCRLTLIEIAPGVELERDVLAEMEFTPAIAEPLAPMPVEIFHERWGKLRSIMLAKEATASAGARAASLGRP